MQLFDLSLQAESPNAVPEINKHYTMSDGLPVIGHSYRDPKKLGLESYEHPISPAGKGPPMFSLRSAQYNLYYKNFSPPFYSKVKYIHKQITAENLIPDKF